MFWYAMYGRCVDDASAYGYDSRLQESVSYEKEHLKGLVK